MTSFQRLRKEARKKSKNKGHELGVFVEKIDSPGIFIAKCLCCNKKVTLDNIIINNIFMEKNPKPIKQVKGMLRGDPLTKNCKGPDYLKKNRKQSVIPVVSTATTGNYTISNYIFSNTTYSSTTFP